MLRRLLRQRILVLFLCLSLLVPSVMLATAVVSVVSPEPVAAYSTGYSGSPCSYANGWCVSNITLHCATNIQVTYYINTGGVYGYQTSNYYLDMTYTTWTIERWVNWNVRVDTIVVDDLGSGCLAGSYLVGVHW